MASLGDVADPMTEIEIDFHIADHPHLGYRKEDRIDWERAYVTDIQQGAFMGDAILRLGGVDFSTVDGWRGLVEWCLRLDSSVRWLESGSPSHVMSEPDSDDHVRLIARVRIWSFPPHVLMGRLWSMPRRSDAKRVVSSGAASSGSMLSTRGRG